MRRVLAETYITGDVERGKEVTNLVDGEYNGALRIISEGTTLVLIVSKATDAHD